MPLALGQLCGASLRPDRFADSADRTSILAPAIDELLPKRDDPRWIRAGLRHVGELHLSRIASELSSQRVDPRYRGEN